MQASGLKTGLFTSPHIHTFRERIQVNKQYISIEEIENILNNVFELTNSNDLKPTFFEITAITAMLKFVSSNVDVIVLETGIGGRLDATNIITKPALSIITTIQHDHCHVLGSTIEEIAIEKCGIIKKDSIYGTLFGPGCPSSVLRVS